MNALDVVRAICSECGAATDWSADAPGKPLCVPCYDLAVEREDELWETTQRREGHGTQRAYGLGCHCPECTLAHRLTVRAYERARREKKARQERQASAHAELLSRIDVEWKTARELGIDTRGVTVTQLGALVAVGLLCRRVRRWRVEYRRTP